MKIKTHQNMKLVQYDHQFKDNRNLPSPNLFFNGFDSIDFEHNILHKDTLQSLVGAAAINVNVKQNPDKVIYQSLEKGKLREISSCNKPSRIKWTQEMHHRFVECVNHLGGPEKATPKKILNLMNLDGLTILQVKSHLQKYRFTKYLPENSEGNNCESSISTSFTSHHHDQKLGMQILEALRLHVDVQKHLHEQLEIQKELQQTIEEQGRFLKMIMNEHKIIS